MLESATPHHNPFGPDIDLIERASKLPLLDAAYVIIGGLNLSGGYLTDSALARSYPGLARAHPKASEAELQNALVAAASLKRDVDTVFPSDCNGSPAVAVSQIRARNPGFTDRTYGSAGSQLGYWWR